MIFHYWYIIIFILISIVVFAFVVYINLIQQKIKFADNILKDFAATLKQLIVLFGRINKESDPEKIQEIIGRIHNIENQSDDIEKKLNKMFLSKSIRFFSNDNFIKLNKILIISNHLEILLDIVLKTSNIILKRRETNSYITPKMRNYIFDLHQVINDFSAEFIQNLNSNDSDKHQNNENLKSKMYLIYDQAVDELHKMIEKQEIKPLSALYYNEIILNYQIIGGLFFKINSLLKKE